MNYLVVCLSNVSRSPYIEKWLTERFERDNINSQVKSAGIFTEFFGGTRINKDLVNWSESILVMEKYMVREISDEYPEARTKKTLVLDIPDHFRASFRDPAFISDFISEDAVKYLQMNRNEDFGRTLMDKILESKYPLIKGLA